MNDEWRIVGRVVDWPTKGESTTVVLADGLTSHAGCQHRLALELADRIPAVYGSRNTKRGRWRIERRGVTPWFADDAQPRLMEVPDAD